MEPKRRNGHLAIAFVVLCFQNFIFPSLEAGAKRMHTQRYIINTYQKIIQHINDNNKNIQTQNRYEFHISPLLKKTGSICIVKTTR